MRSGEGSTSLNRLECDGGGGAGLKMRLRRAAAKGEGMKIAFTTSGKDLDGPLDARFGRAPRFLVYDLEADTFEMIDNTQNLNASQGAGIQSAKAVVISGARALVTGHCGPKAYRALSAAGIMIFTADSGTVSEALGKYRSGGLTKLENADVEGHWA